MNELSVAWMLHSRPYKERSVIAEFLVEGHGRIAMVVRGVRQAKSKHAPLLQPFNKVMVDWRGRGELKTLVSLESQTSTRLLGKALYCGLYINELVLRSIFPGQWLEGLEELYENALDNLSSCELIEPVLRLFELELLEITGYLPSLEQESISGEEVRPGCYYRLEPGRGLVLSTGEKVEPSRVALYPGEWLLALSRRDFSEPHYYPGFKRFTRQALAPLVGEKPIRSRSLFGKRVIPMPPSNYDDEQAMMSHWARRNDE